MKDRASSPGPVVSAPKSQSVNDNNDSNESWDQFSGWGTVWGGGLEEREKNEEKKEGKRGEKKERKLKTKIK